MKSKKGITLIALVITVIVLLILAAVSITALTDEDKGIVTKAKQAAKKTKDATESEDDDIQEILDYAESEDTSSSDDNEITTTPEDNNSSNTEIKNLIPVGGVYTVYSTGEILTGDGSTVEFPEAVEEYDRYVYGDYNYIYHNNPSDTFFPIGWQVIADNTKTTLGAFLETVNGEPITNMCGTFDSSTLVGFTSDFRIPDTVRLVESAFSNCTALKSLPDGVTIPEGCTDLASMFWDCPSLESLPAGFTIPEGAINCTEMFMDCTSLKSLPSGFTIPSSVKNVSAMFDSCTSLNAVLTVNANPTSYSYCFSRCASVTLSGSSTMLTKLKSTQND